MIFFLDDSVMEDVALANSIDEITPESTDAVDGTTYSYQPVVWHWFYLKEIDKTKRIWYLPIDIPQFK